MGLDDTLRTGCFQKKKINYEPVWYSIFGPTNNWQCCWRSSKCLRHIQYDPNQLAELGFPLFELLSIFILLQSDYFNEQKMAANGNERKGWNEEKASATLLCMANAPFS